MNHFEGEASVVVLFDDLIQRQAEWIENQAEVVGMVERLLIPNDALVIFLISFVDVLDYLLLDLG